MKRDNDETEEEYFRNQRIISKIENILFELSPDDVGMTKVGNFILNYEGFTSECWNFFIENNYTIDKVENEMLSAWIDKNYKIHRDGWIKPPVIGEDNIFYCIQRKLPK